MEAQAVIGGDVCPVPLRPALGARLGVPDDGLFVFTLDAAIDAGPSRGGLQTHIPFDVAALAGCRAGRRTIASVASNHLTDFGEGGVAAALDGLRAADMTWTGAGMNRAAAAAPALVDVGSGRLAILSFAETVPRVAALAAAETSAGVNPLDDRAPELVAAARKSADWVWVILHWGEEFVRWPDPGQRRMARRLVEAGATLVAGSHAHVPLGMERVGAGTIFYGLGNLVYPPYRERRGFEYRWHPMSRDAVIVRATLAGRTWRFVPEGVRLDEDGLPERAPRVRCPDLTGASDRSYPSRRLRERVTHVAQRLLYMSVEERLARVRGVFR